MIKYVELTAPESNEFRQAKVTSIEVDEGDLVEVGDTLFRVKSGNVEIDLPATRAGKICEVIVLEGENISVMTPLLLLETEVAGSTATPQLTANQESSSVKIIATAKANDSSSDEFAKNKPVKHSPVKKTKAEKKKKKDKKQNRAKSTESVQTSSKQTKSKHQQQSLDLAGEQAQEDESNQQLEQWSDTQPVLDAGESITTQAESTMSSNTQNSKISIPDIGGDTAKVIELHVKVGDAINIDDSVITLESDKASMDVPSTLAGTVISISAQLDQEMAEGDLILELETSSDNAADEKNEPAVQEQAQLAESTTSSPQVIEVAVPDIGGDSAKVIEILVSVGQSLNKEDPLITLESDKASMEVPSSAAGTVASIEVTLDQEVSEGVVIVKLKSDVSEPAPVLDKQAPLQTPVAPAVAVAANPQATANSVETNETPKVATKSHASPSIRRFARELGVDLSMITGSSRKGRISKGDVTGFVKGLLTSGTAPGSTNQATAQGSAIPAMPAIDFSKFGEIETQPLNRIKRLTATNLHRSWLNVPHVTHHDESNINDLEAFRKQLNQEYAKQDKGVKLSPLAFIVKAVVNALQTYPQFNSSLDPSGENLILKKYVNIGIAVETPNGLVVPVIKGADKMSVGEIATAMGEMAAKARDKKLTTKDMSGAGFTISSLGGIGGTSFTPIINAPEVAILGVSRSKIQAIWDGEKFQPGTMLPLSLSYDHRVIDGAEAARFTRHIASVLEDVRRLAL